MLNVKMAFIMCARCAPTRSLSTGLMTGGSAVSLTAVSEMQERKKKKGQTSGDQPAAILLEFLRELRFDDTRCSADRIVHLTASSNAKCKVPLFSCQETRTGITKAAHVFMRFHFTQTFKPRPTNLQSDWPLGAGNRLGQQRPCQSSRLATTGSGEQ